MLELKVFRQGKEHFCGFYADALTEMSASRAAVRELIVIKRRRSQLVSGQNR